MLQLSRFLKDVMKTFNNLNKAFYWAFEEKEMLNKVKFDLNLSDEFKSIIDCIFLLPDEIKNNYLFKNSYVEKDGLHYEYRADEVLTD